MFIRDCVQNSIIDSIRDAIDLGAADPYPDHPLTLMAPGTWIAVSDSYISDAGLNPNPAVSSGSPLTQTQWDTATKLSSGQTGVFAYSGGCWRESNKSLYIMGGGHGDYHGNEFYRFDVVDMVWKHVNWPSPPPYDSDGINTHYDSSLRPESRHTYGALCDNPEIGEIVVSGASAGNLLGPGYHWTFNADTDTYTQINDPAGGNSSSQFLYDSVEGLIWCINVGSKKLYSMPANDMSGSWTQRNTHNDGANYFTRYLVLDPVNRRIGFIGLLDGSSPSQPYTEIYNITNIASVTREYLPTFTPNDGILKAQSPGLAWDANNQEIVGWYAGTTRTDISIIDLVNKTVTIESASVDNAVTPSATVKNGIFGRWAYVGVWGGKSCFILSKDYNEPVYFYKRA